MKETIIWKCKISDSFYDATKGVGTLKLNISEIGNNEKENLIQFLNEAYSNTGDKFKPDLLTTGDLTKTLNLHTKYEIPFFDNDNKKTNITPEQFGTLAKDQDISISIKFNDNKPNGVYPGALKAAEPLKFKEAYNPFL